jgi:hypothetical protein
MIRIDYCLVDYLIFFRTWIINKSEKWGIKGTESNNTDKKFCIGTAE